MSREYPLVVSEFSEQTVLIEDHIRRELCQAGPVRILEAGCGRKWPLDLKSIEHALTGLDIDEAALDIRKNITRDLDDIIYGDLRYADLGAGQFDVICSAYVLEHITPVVSRHGIRKFCEKLGRLKDNHADLMYILKKD